MYHWLYFRSAMKKKKENMTLISMRYSTKLNYRDRIGIGVSVLFHLETSDTTIVIMPIRCWSYSRIALQYLFYGKWCNQYGGICMGNFKVDFVYQNIKKYQIFYRSRIFPFNCVGRSSFLPNFKVLGTREVPYNFDEWVWGYRTDRQTDRRTTKWSYKGSESRFGTLKKRRCGTWPPKMGLQNCV